MWVAVEKFRRSPGGRAIAYLLAVAILTVLGVRLWHLWGSADLDLQDVQPGVAAAAVIVSTIAVVSYGVVWLVVIRRLGLVARPGRLALFLKSQLGKYIPGTVWQYAGRVGLGQAEEIPANVGLASIAVEVVASFAAAGFVGLLVLPPWIAGMAWAAALAVLAATFAARSMWAASNMTDLLPRARGWLATVAIALIPKVVPLYVAVWLVYGAAFWLTARSLFSVPASSFSLYVGVFALAWAVGFVAVFAPGGVGVREALIVGLLANHLGEARAIVVAGASRLVLTGIDLVLGVLAILFTSSRFSRPQTAEAGR